MKKLFLISIIIVLISACSNHSEQHSVYVCNCQQKKDVQAFIQTSIKNANNMSDEEMEDVIKELRFTAIKTTCQQKNIWGWIKNGELIIDESKTPIDSNFNVGSTRYAGGTIVFR